MAGFFSQQVSVLQCIESGGGDSELLFQVVIEGAAAATVGGEESVFAHAPRAVAQPRVGDAAEGVEVETSRQCFDALLSAEVAAVHFEDSAGVAGGLFFPDLALDVTAQQLEEEWFDRASVLARGRDHLIHGGREVSESACGKRDAVERQHRGFGDRGTASLGGQPDEAEAILKDGRNVLREVLKISQKVFANADEDFELGRPSA